MKLKEIKPGRVIHCENDEEKRLLLEEAERLGYVWCMSRRKPTDTSSLTGNVIYFYESDFKYITHSRCAEDSTNEFSDLIIQEQELSEEEALLAYDQLCNENYCCNDCPIYGILGHECARKMDGHIGEIVDAIKKWKSYHDRKDPEIETEWFWQGRIFKVEKDGSYYQIKDGTGFYDTGCEYQESAEEYMNDILKEYSKTHDGEFIAVVDHVCRVKAVE